MTNPHPSTHLMVSYRTVARTLTVAAVLGLGLTVLGIRDAYTTVGGPHTPAGHVLTVAVVVAVTLTAATLTLGHLIRHRTLTTSTSDPTSVGKALP